MAHAAQILLLAFLVVTFLQSGLDKIMDWKGNLGWLNDHFSKTFLKGMVPVLLGVVLFLEMISSILCSVGIFQLWFDKKTEMGLYGAILSAITLLLLLFGQRVAKDYDGARTIVIYLMPTIFLIYLFQ